LSTEVQVRKEREALLVAAARKASRYFRSVICLRSTRPRSQQPNRHHLCHAEPLHTTLKCYFFRAGGFPKAPATAPPVCILFAGRRRFSAPAHSTQEAPACVWCVCRPLALFSAIAHSISSIIGPLSVSTWFPCAGSCSEPII
jgi:hypothetical protein